MKLLHHSSIDCEFSGTWDSGTPTSHISIDGPEITQESFNICNKQFRKWIAKKTAESIDLNFVPVIIRVIIIFSISFSNFLAC